MKLLRKMYIHVELMREEAEGWIPLAKIFNGIKEMYIRLFGFSSYAMSMAKAREMGGNDYLFEVEASRLKEMICALTLVDRVDDRKVSLLVRGVGRTAKGATGR
jgi:RNase P/RNase MRP subunit POP5